MTDWRGWKGKILRINVTNNIVSTEELEPKRARDYVGGQGLASKYLFDEIDPQVDPLSPDNKLIFATGPATGTAALGGSRYMVVTKSPLTGAIASSNSGGFWGPELKFAGYDMIIFEGKAKEPVYLWIKDGEVEIRPAAHIWGRKTSETQDVICSETHKKAKVACIGPAGENLVKTACIINDEGRAAGRSGVGAVMGAKNIKAVAVMGTGKVPVADEKTLKEIATSAFKKIPQPMALRTGGTSSYLMPSNLIGSLPTRNFQTGVFEGAEKIDGETVMETSFVRRSACYRCPIGCGRITKVTTPPFEGEGAGPEFEGLYSLGACCGIDNLPAIIKAFYICNELGIDVITTGVTIACAMEMFERGFLSEKDIGMKLNFGNAEGMVELVEKIGHRDGFGKELAEGSYRLAEKHGHPEFSMTVKKQEIPGYDPRVCQGMAIEYATSNRGACHMRGDIATQELWGIPVKLDPLETKGKAQYLISLQNEMAVSDSMGICQFLSGYKIGEEMVLAELEAISGAGYSKENFQRTGEKIWNLERLFNLKAGFTGEDDTLPRRLLEEPMPEGPGKGYVAKLGEMLPEYYQLRGWDSSGNPTEDKLRELGIV